MINFAPISLDAKVAFFARAIGFQDLSNETYQELAKLSHTKLFVKGDIIFGPEDPCQFLDLVVDGLVRISIYSALGKRITYLIAKPVEPLNLVGPFNGAPRINSAEVLTDTTLMRIEREEFCNLAFKNPQLIVNIITQLGLSIDSSNSRILDMVEKNVGQRLMRILYTLSEKFGKTLNFTAIEIAELSGTTTESVLRFLSQLRQKGIVEKSRGQIRITDPKALLDPDIDTFWL